MFQVVAKKLKEVRVQSGQIKMVKDDLTWVSCKQSDGSYRVHVDTASHKIWYHILCNLYHMLGMVKRTLMAITETTAKSLNLK